MRAFARLFVREAKISVLQPRVPTLHKDGVPLGFMGALFANDDHDNGRVR